MDSITQIVLGAAVGEAAVGRKIGNRAMLWGAIGGTIPDLDVAANFFTDEISALAFHRGISHSFFFAATAPFVFGWLVHRFYQSGLYRKKGYKIGVSLFWLLFILAGINLIPLAGGRSLNIPVLLVSTAIAAGVGALHWRFYWNREIRPVETNYRSWVLLFFWSIFTHPLLDSCTAYGTQLFQPFWDYRVALNNISIVDPIYTLPFLFCLILAMVFTRNNRWRHFFNWLGIGLSSAYLLLTGLNKMRVDQVYKHSLEEQGIVYERFTTSPTIFNNILWQGVAEGDSAYYHAFYSILDTEKKIPAFTEVPKNHALLEGLEAERDVKILKWFSNGYYNVLERPDGKLQYNDMRYGSFDGTFDAPSDYIFRFYLEQEDGRWVARQTREGADMGEDRFQQFWDRLKGK